MTSLFEFPRAVAEVRELEKQLLTDSERRGTFLDGSKGVLTGELREVPGRASCGGVQRVLWCAAAGV